MATPTIDRCPHRDFYRWAGEAHHDHLCAGCDLRVSYYLAARRWGVAALAVSLRASPVVVTDAEKHHVILALRQVMRRKRLPPLVAP